MKKLSETVASEKFAGATHKERGMKMINLKNVNTENISAILNLNLLDEQKHFVDAGGNRDALAFCYAWTVENKEVVAKGIYHENTVIGLVIYYYEFIDFSEVEFHDLPCYNSDVCWIDYIMIDEKYQGKGYGKIAFQLLMDDIRINSLNKAEYAMIRYSDDNDVARNLYKSEGFKEFAILEDGCYAMVSI